MMSSALLLLAQAYPDPSGDESVWLILNLFLCTFSHSCMASFLVLFWQQAHIKQNRLSARFPWAVDSSWTEVRPETLSSGVSDENVSHWGGHGWIIAHQTLTSGEKPKDWQILPFKSTLISRIFDVFPSTKSNKCVAIFITQTDPLLKKFKLSFFADAVVNVFHLFENLRYLISE